MREGEGVCGIDGGVDGGEVGLMLLERQNIH